eukprot:CAMPEP_0196763928 /NCGR_PEP_ID=MMETSP1095-20130614/5023_1 /TAXON_ID=96789 ORGANISM="Chromulina nebulosa, Strain UTEXLB2642" /NCGR_SAMPLE_ID=MMETSP1095 /ASSEMBLY_ACC=CAM_ASM_000446 /LENGTH=285 /DNA_ID=CAMNT_0042118197 /DNA_START=168 /DNA_END=1025 /DNA_ORIENTATION=+
MSTQVSSERPSTSQGSSRRRRPNGKVANPASSEVTENADNAENKSSYRPRRRYPPRQRVQTAPISDEYLGKTVDGRICEKIKVGVPPKVAFDFINLGDNIDAVEDIPRVYFKRSAYQDDTYFFPRRGYYVAFEIAKDAEGRYFAENVRLTEKGKEEAKISKAEADSKKAARVAAAEANEVVEEKAPQPPRSRPVRSKPRKPKVYDDRVVTFKVSSEGKDEVKDIEVKVGLSLGILKKDLIALFDAPSDYVITYVSEDGKDALLKGQILRNLPEGSRLKFAKPLEV